MATFRIKSWFHDSIVLWDHVLFNLSPGLQMHAHWWFVVNTFGYIFEIHVSEMHFPKQRHRNGSQTVGFWLLTWLWRLWFRTKFPNSSGETATILQQWCFNKDVALATTLVTIPDHDVEGVVEKVKLILGWRWRKWVVQFQTECLLEVCALFHLHTVSFTTVVVLHKIVFWMNFGL